MRNNPAQIAKTVEVPCCDIYNHLRLHEILPMTKSGEY